MAQCQCSDERCKAEKGKYQDERDQAKSELRGYKKKFEKLKEDYDKEIISLRREVLEARQQSNRQVPAQNGVTRDNTPAHDNTCTPQQSGLTTGHSSGYDTGTSATSTSNQNAAPIDTSSQHLGPSTASSGYVTRPSVSPDSTENSLHVVTHLSAKRAACGDTAEKQTTGSRHVQQGDRANSCSLDIEESVDNRTAVPSSSTNGSGQSVLSPTVTDRVEGHNYVVHSAIADNVPSRESAVTQPTLGCNPQGSLAALLGATGSNHTKPGHVFSKSKSEDLRGLDSKRPRQQVEGSVDNQQGTADPSESQVEQGETVDVILGDVRGKLPVTEHENLYSVQLYEEETESELNFSSSLGEVENASHHTNLPQSFTNTPITVDEGTFDESARRDQLSTLLRGIAVPCTGDPPEHHPGVQVPDDVQNGQEIQAVQEEGELIDLHRFGHLTAHYHAYIASSVGNVGLGVEWRF